MSIGPVFVCSFGEDVPAWRYQPRCDACGRFRRTADVVEMEGEDDRWMECRWCMSPADLKHYGMETTDD